MIAARMLADAGERAKRPCRYWDEHFRFADLPSKCQLGITQTIHFGV
jgi:hypothetical protein